MLVCALGASVRRARAGGVVTRCYTGHPSPAAQTARRVGINAGGYTATTSEQPIDGDVMSLDCASGVLSGNGLVCHVAPHRVRVLHALAICGDGFLAETMLTTTRTSDSLRQSIICPLRTAMAKVCVPYGIERVSVNGITGYRLRPGVRIEIA